MNFVTMHNFMQSHKIVTKASQLIVKWQKNVTVTSENCDSNFTKLWTYAKKE